jgi:hypothetical protein
MGKGGGQESGYYVARQVKLKVGKKTTRTQKKTKPRKWSALKKVNNGQHTFNHWMRNPNHHVDKTANWCWWVLGSCMANKVNASHDLLLQ